MRAREMHPLCCISIDCPALPDDLPEPTPETGGCHVRSSEAWAGGEEAGVVGVLYKWTNFGKGWRSRWFSFRGGVLSYSKIPRHRDAHVSLPDPAATGVRIIGRAPARLARAGSGSARAGPRKPVGVVHLKVSSFRESKSDDKRFYIFSPTMTLQLRTESKKDREAWIEALVSARCSVASNENISTSQDDVSFSTEKLRDRMRAEGLGDALIQDCEQIMLSQFSEVHRHLKHRCEEHLCLLKTGRQQLQEVNGLDRSIMIDESGLQLAKHELSSSAHGKFGECSMTESSEEVEKQELDEMSDEDEPYFFDTKDCFNDSTATGASTGVALNHADESCRVGNSGDSELMHVESQHGAPYTCLPIKRREELPKPIGKEKAASLWSVIKDNVGKDLTRICLPVYFNEPLSSLQKCFEDLEYSYLLDQAYEYGKKGNSLMRILNVAAFAVSGYASSDGRPCKPFNPLLGETYESDYPEKGLRFFSEKVSHHPMLIACHCEGRGWKFWGDSNLRSKFWGRSIELEPVGILTLEFDDGEVFQWSKVTTTIYNLILGKVYCDHHGTMNIRGNRQYSCKLKFKEQCLLDRNPRQVQGFVEDDKGAKVSTLIGKWNDSIYYAKEHDMLKNKDCISIENASLLWKRSKPPTNATRYNFTSFAITLNELTSELKEKLPPTDSRLRPDQRHLENGEFEKANVEKLRLEKRQRMSRKLQESGWQPKWFQKDSKSGTYRYVGGYWEAKEQKKWDGCPNIFGDFSDDLNDVQDKQ